MILNKTQLKKLIKENLISEDLRYHIVSGVSVDQNVYRPGSESFFALFREARSLSRLGLYNLSESERGLINETDIGEFAFYEGIGQVPLDFPILIEGNLDEAEYRGRKVKLNKPKRGGPKKFYVYVRNPKTKKIKRVAFGAKGMTTGLRDPKRSKSFEKRHRCTKKKDKTKPGYWACRIGRYPKITGAPYRRWW